jgi:PAS domain S-box-containing protein
MIDSTEKAGNRNNEAPRRNQTLSEQLFRTHLMIAVLGMFILAGGLASTMWMRSRIQHVIDYRAPVVNAVKEVNSGLEQTMSALRGWAMLNDEVFKAQREEAWNDVMLSGLSNLRFLYESVDDSELEARLVGLTAALHDLEESIWWVEEVAQSAGNEPARTILTLQARPIGESIYAVITELVNEDEHPDGDQILLGRLAELKNQFTLCRFSLTEFVNEGASEMEIRFIDHRHALNQRLQNILGKSTIATASQEKLLQRLDMEIVAWQRYADEACAVRKSTQWNVARHLLLTDTRPLEQLASKTLKGIQANQEELLSRESILMTFTVNATIAVSVLLIFVMALVAAGMAHRLASRIAAPITDLVSAARGLAHGQYDDDLPIRGTIEQKQLTRTFIEMKEAIFRARENLEAQVRQRSQELTANVQNLKEEVEVRKRVELEVKSLNETLEQRVAKRTEELENARQVSLQMMEDAENAARDTERANESLQKEITERRAMEATIRESEVRFRQLAENVQEVFWISSPDGHEMIYISPAYEEIWGRTCKSLYEDATNWIEGIHPDDRDRVATVFFEQAVKGGFDQEYRIIRPDGSQRWIRDRGFPVTDESGNVYRVAGIAEDITLTKENEEKLRQHQQQLRSLSSELFLTEQRERQQLAAELHDGLGQLLALVEMKLEMLPRSVTAELLAPLLEDIGSLIHEAHQIVRSLTFQISPPILHELGLLETIEWLTEDIERRYGVPVALHRNGSLPAMDESIRVILFRGIRELLINVAKHAEASRASVKLEYDEDQLMVTIKDDGKGFRPEETLNKPAGAKFGLMSIRESLSHIGGRMDIDSTLDHGTVITLHSPINLKNSEGDS